MSERAGREIWFFATAFNDRFFTYSYPQRLGAADEAYVFNRGGQEIGLHDLAVGCAVREQGETPIVNPVKDSLATKTTSQTTRVAAVVYSSTQAASRDMLEAEVEQFETWLRGLGDGVKAVIAPSFADIFYNNSLKNGLLLIKLDTKTVDQLFNHPLTDKGLDQFLKDWGKVFQETQAAR